MLETDEFAKKAQQAEAAVASVKDPELKRVAFEKILDTLLGQAAGDKKKRASKTERYSQRHKAAESREPARRSGPLAHIEELIDDGFFKTPQTIAAVKAELANRGHHIPLTSLSGPLQRLCQRKRLRRQKASAEGGKQAFAYSNW